MYDFDRARYGRSIEKLPPMPNGQLFIDHNKWHKQQQQNRWLKIIHIEIFFTEEKKIQKFKSFAFIFIHLKHFVTSQQSLFCEW